MVWVDKHLQTKTKTVFTVDGEEHDNSYDAIMSAAELELTKIFDPTGYGNVFPGLLMSNWELVLEILREIEDLTETYKGK